VTVHSGCLAFRASGERAAKPPCLGEWRNEVKIKRHHAAVGFLAAGTLVLSACGSDVNTPAGGGNPALDSLKVECGTKPISAEGSSAQKNAVDVFKRDYGLKCKDQKVNYNPTGSGKGIAAF